MYPHRLYKGDIKGVIRRYYGSVKTLLRLNRGITGIRRGHDRGMRVVVTRKMLHHLLHRAARNEFLHSDSVLGAQPMRAADDLFMLGCIRP